MFLREEWQTIEWALGIAYLKLTEDLERMNEWPESQHYTDADAAAVAKDRDRLQDIHARVHGALKATQRKGN